MQVSFDLFIIYRFLLFALQSLGRYSHSSLPPTPKTRLAFVSFSSPSKELSRKCRARAEFSGCLLQANSPRSCLWGSQGFQPAIVIKYPNKQTGQILFSLLEKEKRWWALKMAVDKFEWRHWYEIKENGFDLKNQQVLDDFPNQHHFYLSSFYHCSTTLCPHFLGDNTILS